MAAYYKEPPADIAERIERLGDPIGKTLKEIIEYLGYPQLELIGAELVVNDEPFMCIWECDGKIYPLRFDHTFHCTEVLDIMAKFVADLLKKLSDE